LNSQSSFVVEVCRGGEVESSHSIVAAVSDRTGKIQSWGDPNRPTIARSAIKSVQALPLVITGAADALSISDQELALACASHSGEAQHVDAVNGWLNRIGLSEANLECGVDEPIGTEPLRQMISQGRQSGALLNCCSGKHAGFLSLCVHHGWDTPGYIKHDSPVQTMVTEAVSTLTGLDANSYSRGIDGCGIPTFALPIARLAYAMARMADPIDLEAQWAAAATRVADAAQLAFWVSGTGRPEVTISNAAIEPIVIKGGAEGVYMVALPDRGMGIALKAVDGTSRASTAAIETLLADMGVLDGSVGAEPTPIFNKAGDQSGETRTIAGAPANSQLDTLVN